MDDKLSPNECQFVSLEDIAEGNDKTPPISPLRHVKLFIRRHISPTQERALFRKADDAIDKLLNIKDKNTHDAKPESVKITHFKEGDMVRVRSKEEIMSTLDHFGKLKGCSFMENEMSLYCNTVHRIHKVMERFVDERELRVKKCKGLVLLDGVMCKGTTAFGRCDRSCFVFWREEWLEKIETPENETLNGEH
jgi:hypothetical protein